jgi:hypothetical protein
MGVMLKRNLEHHLPDIQYDIRALNVARQLGNGNSLCFVPSEHLRQSPERFYKGTEDIAAYLHADYRRTIGNESSEFHLKCAANYKDGVLVMNARESDVLDRVRLMNIQRYTLSGSSSYYDIPFPKLRGIALVYGFSEIYRKILQITKEKGLIGVYRKLMGLRQRNGLVDYTKILEQLISSAKES